MQDRIKVLRKQLKLTQAQFGERIGLKGNTITNYEVGLRNPSDAVVMSICREFNVNEHWLRTGEGDMFAAKADDAVSRFAAEKNMTPLEETILREYMELPPQYRKVIEEVTERMAKAVREGRSSVTFRPPIT